MLALWLFPHARLSDRNYQMEAAPPSLAHVPQGVAAAAHQVVGGKHVGRDFGQVRQPFGFYVEQSTPDIVNLKPNVSVGSTELQLPAADVTAQLSLAQTT